MDDYGDELDGGEADIKECLEGRSYPLTCPFGSIWVFGRYFLNFPPNPQGGTLWKYGRF